MAFLEGLAGGVDVMLEGCGCPGGCPWAGPPQQAQRLCLLSVYPRVKDSATAPVSTSCRGRHGSSEAARQPQFPPLQLCCLPAVSVDQNCFVSADFLAS